MSLLIDTIGWSGAALLLLPYYLISSKRLSAECRGYQLMNVAGSLLLATNTIYYGAFPSAIVNVVWIVIGFYSLLNFTVTEERA